MFNLLMVSNKYGIRNQMATVFIKLPCPSYRVYGPES